MFPVRVPATFVPHITRDDFGVEPGHPPYGEPCPVCGRPITSGPVALVAVGIPPEHRKPSGWTVGAAVAVHTACVKEQRYEDR